MLSASSAPKLDQCEFIACSQERRHGPRRQRRRAGFLGAASAREQTTAPTLYQLEFIARSQERSAANAADATQRAAEVRERVFRSTDTTATSYATHQKKSKYERTQQQKRTTQLRQQRKQ